MPGTTGDLARNRFGLPVGPGQSTRRPQGQDIGHGQAARNTEAKTYDERRPGSTKVECQLPLIAMTAIMNQITAQESFGV